MAIKVVTGPPFSGKSQKVASVRQSGEVLLDTSPLWRTIFDPATGAVRSEEEARMIRAGMRTMLDIAVQEDMDGWLILAVRNPIRLKVWLEAAKQVKAFLISEPREELIARANRAGPTCEQLLAEWDDFESDEALSELTEPWVGERNMKTNKTRYRRACDAIGVMDPDCGVLAQHRCLTEVAELRVERGEDDKDSRVVTGIAVRYGDLARIGSFREKIKPGALELPENGKANLTLQHDRALPLGLLEWTNSAEALRVRSEFPEGARQDQVLADIEAGLLRGLSLEFIIKKEKEIPSEDPEKADVYEIEDARVIRCSVVDDGAYPQATLDAREAVLEAPGEHSCSCGRKATAEDPVPEPTPEPTLEPEQRNNSLDMINRMYY